MKLGPQPEFSISATKLSAEQLCPRQYGIKNYLSWHGWEEGAPEIRRKAYVLGKLGSLAGLFGQSVHAEAERYARSALEGRPLPDLEAVHGRIEHAILEACRQQDVGAFANDPKRVQLLRDVYYAELPKESAIDRILNRIYPTVRRLHQSLLWAEIACFPEALLEQLSSFTYHSHHADGAGELGGTKVGTKLDLFAFDEATGRGLLVDHKTNDGELVAMNQLCLYGLYVTEGLGFDLSDYEIDVRMINWWTGEEQSFILGNEHLERARQWLDQGIERLRVYQADHSENRPVPLSEFPMIGPAGRGLCLSACPYLELCSRQFD